MIENARMRVTINLAAPTIEAPSLAGTVTVAGVAMAKGIHAITILIIQASVDSLNVFWAMHDMGK
jgi:hypothetical protein